ncbi:MAG: UDP-glucose--hexose-1-phosphate uridylyltransferase [Verrucomicrobia bacterium]|nr:UDP-glucose--hexose-1-phosphate uridylyltransferase [Verrucomicrobiota bacterium]
MKFQFDQHPHRRFNPLTNEWILVSPHRTQRPWLGQQESAVASRPQYDPKCYLCPGNERAGGIKNPTYQDTFVFKNDFAALLSEGADDISSINNNSLFQVEPVHGECRVICFSPRHDLTLPELPLEDIIKVVNIWIDQTKELSKKYIWVQIFENKGAVMGCSNPHPHGQIWASSFLPVNIAKEDENQRNYFKKNGTSLLLDYANAELTDGKRIVCRNNDWLIVVPFWATWPYEYLLLPLFPAKRIIDLTEEQKASLTAIMKEGLTKYDNLFETSFPYSMGWHGAPFNEQNNEHWQLHAHYYPPLLRSATIKKFMVGYEMMAEPQRDLTAEQAAKRLRELPSVHYKNAH